MHHLVMIPNFEGSYALISPFAGTRQAVVFVHGFFGDAYSTWQDFQVLIDEYENTYKEWKSCDVFFFEYPAARSLVASSADTLRKFVESIYPKPPDTLFVEDLHGIDWGHSFLPKVVRIRKGPYHYSKLTLVGHSLGAVIIRQIIADEATEYSNRASILDQDAAIELLKEYPLLSADTRLMSSAHLGFRPLRTLGAAFSFRPTSGFLRMVLNFLPAFDELSPESHVIRSLQSRTESLAKDHPYINALSAALLWGEHESVVTVGGYACDLRPTIAAGRGHVSVCKPLRSYQQPLQFLCELRMYYGKQAKRALR